MKKISLIVIIFLFSVQFLFSQSLQMEESNYYRIYTDLDAKTAEEIVSVMDSYLLLFNKYLHFDTDMLTSKLKIRLFSKKSDFDTYLNSTVSRTSDGYVLLQYRDSSKNELVAYIMQDQDKMRKDFIHYGFIQFFKAYINYPPLWLMNGLAVYFENTEYSLKDSSVSFKKNYDWVPTLKKAIAKGTTIPIDSLLVADYKDAASNISVFYAQSWGLVDFLLSSSYIDYNRILWDSLSALKEDATSAENESAVISKAFKWIDKETFASDFVKYAKSINTYSDLLALGTEAYSKGNYSEALKYFNDAVAIDADGEIPYYYMGLINYVKNDYTAAENYYHKSLKYSKDKDRVYYALAVNAFADSRLEDSQLYIKSISSKGRETYKDKLDDLLSRINKKKKS